MTPSNHPSSALPARSGRGAYDRRLTASERARIQRQNLLHTAHELILRSGLPRLTVEQVVREAGMGRNTFYSHFENSDELLAAVLKDAASRFEGGWKLTPNELPPTPTEAMHEVARRWFAVAVEEGAAVRLMLTVDRTPLAACFERALRPALQQGERSGLMGRAADPVAIACACAVGVELTQQAVSLGASRDWPGTMLSLLLALLR
jgi:AcrR family transcriptional regulator